MAHLEKEFGPANLQINQQKCKVFCSDSVELPPSLSALPRVSLSAGSVFLGVPVGGDAFIRQFNDQTVSKVEDVLTKSKSSRLQSGLGKFLILRACFGACRVTHLLRSFDFHDDQSSTPFRRAL